MVGNLPHFREIDVLRTIIAISESTESNLGSNSGRNTETSRAALVKRLELGEGTVRSILDILKQKDIIASSRKGHFIAGNGKIIVEKIKSAMSFPKEIALHINNMKGIGLLYNKNISITCGLRDTAIKNGAEGAVLFNYKNGMLDMGCECNENFSYLIKNFDSLKDGNSLLTTYSPIRKNAEAGVLAVALELDSELKKIIRDII